MNNNTLGYSIHFSFFAAGLYPEKPLYRQDFRIFGEKPFSKDGSALGLGINGKGLGYYYFGARYYDPELGIYICQDGKLQFSNPYGYSNNPLIYVDPDGNWFLIDDLISAGVGFAIGYVSYGIKSGNWGGRALMYGAIGAGAAWLTWNTGGAAAGAATSFWSAVGYGAASGAVGGAFTAAATYTEKAAYGSSGYSTSNLKQNWDAGDFAKSTAFGAVAGAATGAVAAGVTYGIKTGYAAWKENKAPTGNPDIDQNRLEISEVYDKTNAKDEARYGFMRESNGEISYKSPVYMRNDPPADLGGINVDFHGHGPLDEFPGAYGPSSPDRFVSEQLYKETGESFNRYVVSKNTNLIYGYSHGSAGPINLGQWDYGQATRNYFSRIANLWKW